MPHNIYWELLATSHAFTTFLTDSLDIKIFNSFIETNTLIIFLIIPLELTRNQ